MKSSVETWRPCHSSELSQNAPAGIVPSSFSKGSQPISAKTGGGPRPARSGWPGGAPDGAPALVVYVAGPIELIGGLLLVVGLLVRPVAFLCSGLMAAAYWMAHGTQALFPILNKGELAALYCFVFLFISAHGAGIWSVDGARSTEG